MLTPETFMNIETRISDLDRKLRTLRITGPLGLAGVVFLYLALVIPIFESKPVLVLCATLSVALVVPSLLRWHAFTIERRVLENLKQRHELHAT
ncbi:MAG: hypothetical protein EPO07_02420 [Verrucomicrobia bacterium]|nr:MAG: hypothetical protein EPO07_02420 [Verrucomicrobiota bacterium]